jgi:anti-sigma regulatory factor (Ser/Thr protein kinase)
MELPSSPPYRSSHPLDGRPGSVTAALGHARAFLRRCSPQLSRATAGDLLLVVSELVTNAVRHAPGPCTLDLACNGQLEVAVSDTSSTVPVARAPDPGGTGGFGWLVVNEVSQHVRVRLRPPYGKTVTATLGTGALISPGCAARTPGSSSEAAPGARSARSGSR